MCRLLNAFGLRAESVGQITWASTDLADWPNSSVVVVLLDEKQDAGVLQSLGQPVELHVGGVRCRRLASGWEHPFAVLDTHRLITGREDLLRQLAASTPTKLTSTALDRFVQAAALDSDILIGVDLGAARRAGWRLPEAAMDVWPPGRKAWHVLWETPQFVGVTLRQASRASSELALACEGETSADQVQAALAELVPAANRAVDGRLQRLSEDLRSGRINAATARHYESALKLTKAALAAAHWQVAEEMVWVRIDWGQSLGALTEAVLRSRPAIRNDWLHAALAADEANTRRLLSGLMGYGRAEGAFPAGAAGGVLLPPETRLSWIATLLPYYDHRDWHDELQFGYSWNSPQNRPVTRRVLEHVINPALGAGTTEAGFPVTHYVGMAGVGADAAELKPGDPRAGVFGYNRTTRPEDIPDGASHTIALVGVSSRLGAWAAGGEATIRALTRRPYVNGPDGFGSGQPDGMLVGMADGSVRFLSKDIDPTVLEQMATIGGRGSGHRAALRPKPAEAKVASEREVPAAGSLGKSAVAPTPLATKSPLPSPTAAAANGKTDARGVQARLAAPVPALDLPGVSLHDAVRLISQLCAVPITVDLNAMAQQGVTLKDRLTMQLSRTTVAGVLEKVAAARGMVCIVQDDQLLLTSPAQHRKELQTVRYTVSDLAGQDPLAATELAGMVQKLVAPETWQPAGGRGTLRVDDGALLVSQTAAVHHLVLTFCEKLRVARGKPLRSAQDPERFRLVSRLARARLKLARRLTANFPDPTPLARVVSDLETIADVQIAINWLRLAAVGVSPEATVTLKAQNRPLAEVLDGLLQPIGLAYRAIDADTLEITSAKELSSHLETEFYPLRGLVDKGLPAPAVLERIQSEVAASSWADAGGPGILYFDEPSQCLIVYQTQPVQKLLEASLARWEAENK